MKIPKDILKRIKTLEDVLNVDGKYVDLGEILDGTDEEVEARFDEIFREIGEKNPAALHRWEHGKRIRAEREAKQRERLLGDNR